MTDQAEGFSLVELVIVIAVLSTLTVAALLSLRIAAPGTSGDAKHLLTLFDNQRELAVHGQMQRGLDISQTGLSIWRKDGARLDWKALGGEHRWDNTAFTTVFGRSSNPARGSYGPNIVFFTDGSTTVFEVAFVSGGDRTICKSDGWTALTCAKP
ncbi:MAG: prepilin-type N-terminal cleavage/methylation domain-containing protein [Rhodobacteraceae bacterium]|nr:prepilin-type N-terminal cleavage/methylation domain-containing protein [Paracoccaceae bacterium]